MCRCNGKAAVKRYPKKPKIRINIINKPKVIKVEASGVFMVSGNAEAYFINNITLEKG